MLKKEIYPKTARVSCLGDKVFVTEKLDGSNLCIFKKDVVLYVAQRKTILRWDELDGHKDVMYKGLYQWLKEHQDYFAENLANDACLCGEWLGMGNLKYTIDEFDKKFYMFAKANIDENFNLYNIMYDHELFKYPFIDQEIPSFIGVVPEVAELNVIPNKEHLDSLYERYCNKVNRNVEGFVVNYKNIITKYVRMKNGKLQEHFDREEK